MTSIYDYLNWRGDLTFKESKFNIVDSAILSFLSYINYDYLENIPIDTYEHICNLLYTKYEEKEKELVSGLIIPKSIVGLCTLASKSNRFGNCLFTDFINHIDIDEMCQFCALTFHLSDDEMVMVIRGTDDTTIGWQENCEMICSSPVQAETKSLEYLNNISSKYPNKKIYITGHSKGGHLAEYAAIHASKEIQNRIIHVYSNDGQGFMPGSYNVEELNNIINKITLVIPNQTVVGMLFDTIAGEYVVVKSQNNGLFQHDISSWEVMGNHFVTKKHISKTTMKLNSEISNLILGLSKEERMSFSDDIYNFIITSELFTLTKVTTNLKTVLKQIHKINIKNRILFFKLIKLFIIYKAI